MGKKCCFWSVGDGDYAFMLQGLVHSFHAVGMEYVRLMRECGVTSEKVYNVNAGFFIIKKEAVDVVYKLVVEFADYVIKQGYLFPDEPALAYALHILAKSPEDHRLDLHRDVWGSDWEGVFESHMPDGEPWIFKDYMSHEPQQVNPAIVHAVRSKQLLTQSGIK